MDSGSGGRSYDPPWMRWAIAKARLSGSQMSGWMVSGVAAPSRVSRGAFQQGEKGGAKSSRQLLGRGGDISGPVGPTTWARECPNLAPGGLTRA